ncbi:hypothetical protein ABKY80_003724 [Vibrio harveyi]
MTELERTQTLFESLSKVNMNIEGVLKIAGLDELATCWVMFAYVTPELDVRSFERVNSHLVMRLIELGICEELSQKLVRIAIEEKVQCRTFAQRTRAAVIGVSQYTYSTKRERYEPGIVLAHHEIKKWEDSAKRSMVAYNNTRC